MQKTASMGEVNDKLRDLLTGHVNSAIRKASEHGAKVATEEALKALKKTIGEKAFLADVSKRLADKALSGVNKRLKTVDLVDTIGDLAAAKAIAAAQKSLDKKVDALSARVVKAAVGKTVNAMKTQASTLGRSALPHVLSLVQDWLTSDAGAKVLGDAGGGGGDPELAERLARLEEQGATGVSAELLVEFETRLRRVEAEGTEGASLPDLDLTARLVQLESAGLEDRLIALEERPPPAEFDEAITDELDERIAALEARELNLPPEADRGLIAGLEERVALLEERPSGGGSAVGAVLTTESEDLAEVAERLLSLETSRTEFVEQVVEQVASHGEEVTQARSELEDACEDIAAVAKRVRELSERVAALNKSGPASPGPSDVPPPIDLKDLAERVAVLAVGPLTQAIDGRLGEANLEDLQGLPERIARLEEQGASFDSDALTERIAVQAVAKAMEALDGRLEGLRPRPEDATENGEARTHSEESDSGYLEEDFVTFRKKRLEEKEQKKARESDRLLRDEVNSGWESGEDAEDEPVAEEGLVDHGSQWAREPLPEGEEEESTESDDDELELPTRKDGPTAR